MNQNHSEHEAYGMLLIALFLTIFVVYITDYLHKICKVLKNFWRKRLFTLLNFISLTENRQTNIFIFGDKKTRLNFPSCPNFSIRVYINVLIKIQLIVFTMI